MSIIVVEGHKIETKDIFSLDDAPRGYHGFVIRLIDKPQIKIVEWRDENLFNFKNRDISDRYRRLRDDVEKQWEADKTDLKVFKL